MKKLSLKKRVILLGVAAAVVLVAAGAVWAMSAAKPVEVMAVSEKYIEDAFYEDGVVRAQTRAAVSAETGGRVTDVHVREGQTVRKGEALLTLSADDLLGERAQLEAELSGVYAAWRQSLDQTEQQIAALAVQRASQHSGDITGWLNTQIMLLETSLDPMIAGSAAYSFERMFEMTDARMAHLNDQLRRAEEQTPAEVQSVRAQLDAAVSQSASVSNQQAQYAQQTEAQRIDLEAQRAKLTDPVGDADQIALYDALLSSLSSNNVNSSYQEMQSVADAQVSRLRRDLQDAEAQIPLSIDSLHTQMLALESERRALEDQYGKLTQGTHSQILTLIAQRDQAAGALDAQRRTRSALDNQRKLLEASMENDSGTGAYYLAQAERIEAALRELDRRVSLCEITAPIDGTVGRFDIREGAFLAPGVEITEIIDPNSLMVECMLLTGDVDSIPQNSRVIWEKREGDVEFDAALDAVSPVAVSSLSAVGLAEQRVKVWLAPAFGEDGAPGDGYQVRVRFISASESALTVPRKALVKTDRGDAVYVLTDGKAELRAVKLGLEGGGEIAVTDGLRAGELVVSDPEARASALYGGYAYPP